MNEDSESVVFEVYSPIESVMRRLSGTLRSKGEDYKMPMHGSLHFSNFMSTANMAGVSVDDVFFVMISTKINRIIAQRDKSSRGVDANHESLMDSIEDLANYLILYLAYREENGTF